MDHLNKDLYRKLSVEESGFRIFQKGWWLDVACVEEDWDAVINENNGRIESAWALPFYRKHGRKVYSKPALTQFIGPWIRREKNHTDASWESYRLKKCESFIENIPPFDIFRHTFHYSFDNWLPFYWEGFEQTTRYTYVIDLTNEVEEIEKRFAAKVRSEIRKAESKCRLERADDVDLLYSLVMKTYERQGMPAPYSKEFLKRVYDACIENDSAEMFIAYKDQHPVAGALFVHDSMSCYYLVSGADPEYRNSGAGSLIIREAVRHYHGKVEEFDFEGSMDKNIESFFRSFGSVRKDYYSISRIDSRLLKLYFLLRDSLR
ncbi:GNAT family N-acetyltransferase [Limisalsivibrio acetivorans]|uniref:GNAT family N-acetyltransferase n=1 Tax=Limisalsivibrio acetivorans TaxID=1304888 RepID=UPI0003B4290D|nr:GNAT family N-acetyltransferase [Limisalsivibrio acetivorans]